MKMKTVVLSLFALTIAFTSIGTAAAQDATPTPPPTGQSCLTNSNNEPAEEANLLAHLEPKLTPPDPSAGDSSLQRNTNTYTFYYLDDLVLTMRPTDVAGELVAQCNSYRVEFILSENGNQPPLLEEIRQSFVKSISIGQEITQQNPLIFRTAELVPGTYTNIRITFFQATQRTVTPTPTATFTLTPETTEVAQSATPTPSTETTAQVQNEGSSATPSAEATDAVQNSAPTSSPVPTEEVASGSDSVTTDDALFNFRISEITDPQINQLVILSNLTPQLQELIAAVALFAGVMLVMAIATEIVVDTLRLFLGMKRKLAPMEAIKQLQETLPSQLAGLGVQGEGLREVNRLLYDTNTLAQKSDQLDTLVNMLKPGSNPHSILEQLKALVGQPTAVAVQQAFDNIKGAIRQQLQAYIGTLLRLDFFKASGITGDALMDEVLQKFDLVKDKSQIITDYARWILNDLQKRMAETFYTWAQVQTTSVMNANIGKLATQMQDLGLEAEQAKQTAESVAMLTQGASLVVVQEVIKGVNERRTEIENSFWRLFTYPFEWLKSLFKTPSDDDTPSTTVITWIRLCDARKQLKEKVSGLEQAKAKHEEAENKLREVDKSNQQELKTAEDTKNQAEKEYETAILSKERIEKEIKEKEANISGLTKRVWALLTFLILAVLGVIAICFALNPQPNWTSAIFWYWGLVMAGMVVVVAGIWWLISSLWGDAERGFSTTTRTAGRLLLKPAFLLVFLVFFATLSHGDILGPAPSNDDANAQVNQTPTCTPSEGTNCPVNESRQGAVVALMILASIVLWGLFTLLDRWKTAKHVFIRDAGLFVTWLFFNICSGIALRLLVSDPSTNPNVARYFLSANPWILLPAIYLVVFLGWLKSQDTTALIEKLKQSPSVAFLSQTLIKLEDVYRDDENNRIRSVRLLSVVVGISVAVIARVDAADLFTTTVPAFSRALKSLPAIDILPNVTLTAGMLLTGLAASAGSTFWHDILDRLRATKDTAEQIARLTRQAQEIAQSQRTP
jgi:hypothetical protein